MSGDVLIISDMEGAENCARIIAGQVAGVVEVAATMREGLEALRAAAYGVVVVEEKLVESDEEWANQVWAAAGLAIPLQVNFGIAGCARLLREVKAALIRREGEHGMARRAAAKELENDLKTSVTGLLLESQLVLQEAQVPASLQPKLRHLMELAAAMRERLRANANERR